MAEIELRPAKHWDERCKRLNVILDGREIGHVEQFHPSFERGPRGRPYVTKRWTAKRPYWAAFYEGAHNPYRLPCETRKKAVQIVVDADARRKGEL